MASPQFSGTEYRQQVLQQVISALSTASEEEIAAVADNLAVHIANPTGAHAASAISFTPTGTIASTDTQAAVAEVATDAANASNLTSGTLPLARLSNITDTQIAAANKDGAAGTASMRTLGTGAAQAAAGNAAPNAHATSHSSGGSDPITVSNLAGSVAAAQMPALTGDVTTSAGAVATTIAANVVSMAKLARGTDGQVIVGQTSADSIYKTMSGDATLAASGALTIAAHAVTNAKAAQMAASTIKGNNTAGTADAADLTTAQTKTLLAIAAGDVSGLAAIATSGSASDLGTGTLPAGRMPALTGDVTNSSGTLGTTIAAKAVTLAKMNDLATATLIGRNTAGTGVPEALSTIPTGTMPALTGDVTNSAGSLATTISAKAVTLAKMNDLATATLIGRNTAGTGVPEALSTIPTGTMPALTGDVTNSAGSLATTIAAKAVTLAKMNDMATASLLGRNTAGTGVPEVLSAATSRSLLSLVVGTNVQAWDADLDTLAALASITNLTALAGLSGAASKGIQFTGAGAMSLIDFQAASTSWTPVMEGSSTAGGNTYDVQVGRYIRIGNIIHLWMRLHVSVKNSGGTMAGNIRIGGLPFTSISTTNQYVAVLISSVEDIAFGSYLTGQLGPNDTKVFLIKNSTGTAVTLSNVAAADVGSAPGIHLYCAYEV